MTALMLVENTLQLVGRLLYVLFPLSLEKLQALTGNRFWMLILQVLHG